MIFFAKRIFSLMIAHHTFLSGRKTHTDKRIGRVCIFDKLYCMRSDGDGKKLLSINVSFGQPRKKRPKFFGGADTLLQFSLPRFHNAAHHTTKKGKKQKTPRACRRLGVEWILRFRFFWVLSDPEFLFHVPTHK